MTQLSVKLFVPRVANISSVGDMVYAVADVVCDKNGMWLIWYVANTIFPPFIFPLIIVKNLKPKLVFCWYFPSYSATARVQNTVSHQDLPPPSGSISAVKEPGYFEVRKSSSQVIRMHFFPQKKVDLF